MGSSEPSSDANRHFQEDFINNFNSAIETAETKLMGNICELKDDHRTQTKYWQRAELTAKNKVIESLILS